MPIFPLWCRSSLRSCNDHGVCMVDHCLLHLLRIKQEQTTISHHQTINSSFHHISADITCTDSLSLYPPSATGTGCCRFILCCLQRFKYMAWRGIIWDIINDVTLFWIWSILYLLCVDLARVWSKLFYSTGWEILCQSQLGTLGQYTILVCHAIIWEFIWSSHQQVNSTIY